MSLLEQARELYHQRLWDIERDPHIVHPPEHNSIAVVYHCPTKLFHVLTGRDYGDVRERCLDMFGDRGRRYIFPVNID